jgi:hypothetical protein
MKTWMVRVIFAGILSLGIGAGHMSMAESLPMEMDQGMHVSQDAPMGCGDDTWCFFRCQGTSAALLSAGRAHESVLDQAGWIAGPPSDERLIAGSLQVPLCTAFSPPDDPVRMLSLRKRE